MISRNDVQALQERAKTVEAQLGKITESQTLILAKLAGKAEPNPVEDLKMVKVQRKQPKELDYSNAPSPTYTVEDLVKRITLKIPVIEGGDEAMYQHFINQVAIKVREMNIRKLLKNYLLNMMIYLSLLLKLMLGLMR